MLAVFFIDVSTKFRPCRFILIAYSKMSMRYDKVVES